MKILIAGLVIFFISACANLIDSNTKSLLFEEQLFGEHAALASCVTNKLQSDGRTLLRPLQFRNRRYSDIEASEIHAYDTRYRHNATATYAPSNPDAILIYGHIDPEIQSSEQRSNNDKAVYSFALLLQKIDSHSVQASLRGDSFIGNIAWETLQSCLATGYEP
ncbi:hypothetical protein [Nitrosomonas supralitoralis]|uniref:Uncharacterized protein n=1 Tax=Nitrosomonas supralitoralis TaxID=2116706 RepID=A0A2P7NW37_9PROT|nr:hypothetical protein [Nitrosomonas supralitoralis]PSJ17687.1 hypothetical protein C7H79_06660 [Nitrosomonas supralitoralis]